MYVYIHITKNTYIDEWIQAQIDPWRLNRRLWTVLGFFGGRMWTINCPSMDCILWCESTSNIYMTFVPMRILLRNWEKHHDPRNHRPHRNTCFCKWASRLPMIFFDSSARQHKVGNTYSIDLLIHLQASQSCIHVHRWRALKDVNKWCEAWSTKYQKMLSLWLNFQGCSFPLWKIQNAIEPRANPSTIMTNRCFKRTPSQNPLLRTPAFAIATIVNIVVILTHIANASI